MTAALADAPAELGRAARCWTGARRGPGTEAAAVLWLDYDAPDFLPEARGRPAGTPVRPCTGSRRGCAPRTRGRRPGRPCSGTATARWWSAPRPATTGWAPTRWSSSAPRVGVDHAAELRVPPGQVWAATAPDDVIRLARPPEELARRALLAGSPLGRAAGLLDPHDDRLWFGTDPSTPGFGGRRFPSGRHGHAGYWDPGNPALDGMARIVLGR
ncbi:hypothetical protein Nm8I071_03150 [Nonomuraea sp. TT08I-71]|nr:hypothetical protein Nm8I071_03150 [Nonomuraea sp. TT08I-71]